MKRNLIVSALLLLYSYTVVGQESIKEYILNSTSKIKSIHPNDTNFADLQIIGKSIGDARVVMLGEQDHGDAPTFQAKARLIKYLHQKLGFNVIAFESDFFALTQGWNQVLRGRLSVDSLIEANIFPVWTKCSECKDIFTYIETVNKNNQSLHVAGFDIQLRGEYSKLYLKKELIDYLTASHIAFLAHETHKNEFVAAFDSLFYYSRHQGLKSKSTIFHKMAADLDTILSQVEKLPQPDSFWIHTLQSIKAQCQNIIYWNEGDIGRQMALRDENMAKNLIWLLENKYKNEKIIVWAANFHINKHSFEGPKETYGKLFTMGYYLNIHKELAHATYSIGFTSYTGKYGRIYVEPMYVNQPKKNSFETWVRRLNYEYAFTDLKAFNRRNGEFNQPFFMKGIGHFTIKADWTKAYDGLFYIYEMFPCTKE